MKVKNLLKLLPAIMLVSTLESTYAQDWPQFRGPERDCKVTAFKSPASWPAELTQSWKINVGTGDASPILAGGRLYLHTRQGADEVILCLDASTGKEYWRSSYPAVAVTGPAASHPGPRSTPALSDGKVITVGVAGVLTCVEASGGKILWRKENPENLWPQFFTGMSPLIADGLCIVHLGTKDKGTVYCLNLKNGEEKWKWQGDGPSYSSPSIMKIDGKKHVIIHTEKNLMALNLADGKLIWQLATPVMQRFYNCVSPCINGQTIYYTGAGSGMKAIKVEKQGEQYVTKELWANASVGAKWNTPVLKDGFLYGFTDARRIYCINATDGQTAWIDETVNSDFATLVDCGDVLMGLPSTSRLILFRPDSKAYSEIAAFKVADTPVYSFPLVSGNGVYIKDAENIALFKF